MTVGLFRECELLFCDTWRIMRNSEFRCSQVQGCCVRWAASVFMTMLIYVAADELRDSYAVATLATEAADAPSRMLRVHSCALPHDLLSELDLEFTKTHAFRKGSFYLPFQDGRVLHRRFAVEKAIDDSYNWIFLITLRDWGCMARSGGCTCAHRGSGSRVTSTRTNSWLRLGVGWSILLFQRSRTWEPRRTGRQWSLI